MNFKVGIILLSLIQFTLPVYGDISEKELDLIYLEIINNVEKGQTNENGALSWGESYLLFSLLDMYEATGDLQYLDVFVERSNLMFTSRDSERGIEDYFRGTMMPAWGSSKYTDGKWMVWLGHTGMILKPVARFVSLVRENPLILEGYQEISTLYIYYIKLAVSAHQSQWTVWCNEGVYLLPPKHKFRFFFPRIPYNMSLALGAVLLDLFSIGEGEDYLEIITYLAESFKKRMYISVNGVVEWPYIPDWWSWKEDTSHAVIDLEFLYKCAESGIVFDKGIIEDIEKSFFNNILKDNGKVSKSLDGRKENFSNSLLYRWGSLFKDGNSAVRIFPFLKKFIEDDEIKKDGTWAHTYAVFRYVNTQLK